VAGRPGIVNDLPRRARLRDALRGAVTERYRAGGGPLTPEQRARFVRRQRDCASLVRLGVPATETRDLARRLDLALRLGVGDDASARESLALDLTALLVELYAEFLAVEVPLRRG
jgi:hypothetical protein